jgi:hypothetical protein
MSYDLVDHSAVVWTKEIKCNSCTGYDDVGWAYRHFPALNIVYHFAYHAAINLCTRSTRQRETFSYSNQRIWSQICGLMIFRRFGWQ